MGKRGGPKKGVLKGPIAQCRGVERAKNNEYNANQLPILFDVDPLAQHRKHGTGHWLYHAATSVYRPSAPLLMP